MTSLLYDALAGVDTHSLLKETAEIVASAFDVDHVLVLERGAVRSQSCSCASVGWKQAAAMRLGKQLLAQARQHDSADETQSITDEAAGRGAVFAPSRTFLQQQELQAGMFVCVASGAGVVALFVGDAQGGRTLSDESQRRFLQAIAAMLCSLIGQESNELARVANLEQVVEAKHQWQAALDALPQLVCLVDGQGLVIRANRTLETWKLGDVFLIRGTTLHDMLHPGCAHPSCVLKTRLESIWRQLEDTDFAESIFDDIVPESELYLSMSKCQSSRYEDAAAEQGYAFLLVEKIGQRKRIERLLMGYNSELDKQLREQSVQLRSTNTRLQEEIRAHQQDKMILQRTERKYACFVENTLTGIYAIRNNGVSYYNERFAEIFGYSGDEIYQLGLHELFPFDKQLTIPGQMTDCDLPCEIATIEGRTKSGETIWVQRSLNTIDSLMEPMLLGNVVDVTAQKNAEDALRSSERELRNLSDKLLLAQEAERKRIALELHDGIGQSLSAIKFSLESALQNRDNQTPEQNRQHLKSVVDKLRGAIEEVRAISMGLRPSMLDDLGLITTIDWLCREFQSAYPNIRFEKRITIAELDVPNVLKIVVFRILQEALNNIEKHAKATAVAVELARTGNTLTLRVKDNGRGISQQVRQIATGVGLGSMKERAQLTSASFSIDSSNDRGTVIEVVWPDLWGSLQ